MNLRALWNDDNLLWEALVISLAAHVLLFHAGEFSVQFQKKHTVEIDISNMGHIGTPGGGHVAAPPPPPKPRAAPAKEWIKPAPDQKVIPATIPTQSVVAPSAEEEPSPGTTSTANGTGEYGIGTGDGTAGALSRLPQLLNLSDLGRILNRFYPEEARAAHKEGSVTVDLHIDGDGHVQAVDVIQSGGPEFDKAATQVVKLLRFTPAFVGSQRVAVKLRQTINFKLAGR